MGVKTDFFVGPFLRVTSTVTQEQREVGTWCPDPDCGMGEKVPNDACFCPRCGGETEPVLGPREEWVDPDDGDDDFHDEFCTSDSWGDPGVEEIDDGRRVRRFIYLSNQAKVPGCYVNDLDESFQLIGPRLIELSVKTFLEVHGKRLSQLRARFGDENVEVLYGALICYR